MAVFNFLSFSTSVTNNGRLTLTFMVIDVFLAATGFLLKGVITGLAVSFCLPCVLSFLDFMGCQVKFVS